MPPVSTAMPADETPVPPSSDGGRSGERGSFRADEVEADEDDFDVDAFNEWMRRRRQERPPRHRQLYSDDDDDSRDGGGQRTSSGPPPEWSGEDLHFQDYLIKARLWLATTKAKPRTRGPLLLQKLSKIPFETMKHLAKDRQWMESDRNGEELLEFMDLPENFGDDRDEDLLSALAKVTYHLRRNKDESHRQFFNRWEQAMRKVKEHGVTLPEKYVGFLLVNALQLSEGDIKALLNYSRGSISPVDVRDWIRKHETKLQLAHVGVDRKSGSTSTKSSTASANYIVNEPYDPEIEEEINMVEDALRDLQGDEDEDGEGLGDGTGSGLESILEENMKLQRS